MGELLNNSLKQLRDRLGFSQQALADRVGVTRQAIIAIEAGRQVPSTSLGLQLAHALGCRVEDLFQVIPATGLEVRMAPSSGGRVTGVPEGARVLLGFVGERWIAHRLPPDATVAADAIVLSTGAESTAIVQPLTDPRRLRDNVLVAGCAPLLGVLAHRFGARFAQPKLTWLPASSQHALDLLAAGLIHMAGLHFSDSGQGNTSAVRRTFPRQHMLLVNLTRWRQGFVVPCGNPLGIHTAKDLLRADLRLARREEGAGAQKLVHQLLTSQGADDEEPPGPFAEDHADVARLVRSGAADVGVAIENVAIAAGLGFIPLAEERFDLVTSAEIATIEPVGRLIDTINEPGFRTEVAHIPGYDGTLAGQVTTLDGS